MSPEYACPGCGRRFAVGRAKSGHMRHCGKKLGLARPEAFVAMRCELRRIARLCGRPEGVAPSLYEFRTHSAWSDKRILGALGGYRNHNPIIGWKEAMRRLGFVPAQWHYQSDRRRVAEDIHRVARELGHPRKMPTQSEYNEHGRWWMDTARLHFGGARWNEIADMLGLEPNLPPPYIRAAS